MKEVNVQVIEKETDLTTYSLRMEYLMAAYDEALRDMFHDNNCQIVSDKHIGLLN